MSARDQASQHVLVHQSVTFQKKPWLLFYACQLFEVVHERCSFHTGQLIQLPARGSA